MSISFRHFLIIFVMVINHPVIAQFTTHIELGTVTTGYNDVRIPGNEGSDFSLKDDLESQVEFFYRLQIKYTLKERHDFLLLYAPLQTVSQGSFTEDVYFSGTTFPANIPTEGIYMFNSYRFTYRYQFLQKTKVKLGIGLTGKIRDAEISLSNESQSANKSNLGFVPLIAFYAQWNLSSKWHILMEGDALIAAQGRAEDVLLALSYSFSEKLSTRAGYRVLEGGADGGSVYNFALFHYASFGVDYTF